jgi:hypothetical protein
LGYAAIHILPSPQNYMALNQIVFSGIRTPPLLSFNPVRLLISVLGLFFALLDQFSLLAPALVWAIYVLLRRKTAAGKTLLVFALSLAISFACLVSYYTDFYMILVAPAFALLLATALLGDPEERKTNLERIGNRVAWGLVLAQFVVFVGFEILPDHSYRDFRAIQERLGRSIHQGDSIAGSQTYWFGLYDHRYYSWEIFAYYQKRYPQSTLEEALCRYRPDIFLRDGHLDQFITGNLIPGLRLPEGEIEPLLERYGTLVDDFDGGVYRQVRVYRFDWHEGCRSAAGGESK